ncbi:hypothetical protein PG997_011755 [Apiospora hydei]|uniref:Dockerin type 1 n=1 Tax=Apiospora hydei TaxID=1337664 RepID=A0ABR1V1E8_9PEZI
MLLEPTVSVLGTDPSWRKHVLNGNAFQQDAIQSFNGWQYACFYSDSHGPEKSASSSNREPLYVHLSRRKLPLGKWETLVFHDYLQTTDDGHNTVQLGICPGDGTIHLSYDHHCDQLRYRHSTPGLATDPESFSWSARHFTPTLHHLPGLESSLPHAELLSNITYPRFGQLGADLWFSFRTGKAGLGDDHLYLYSASRSTYSPLCDVVADATAVTATTPFLKGIQNNPYIHGLDARDGTLYVTWVYRDFVWYAGWDDPADTQHKQQAGPNSAANKPGPVLRAWRNGAGDVVTDLGRGESITPSSPGVTAFRIPKGSGLTNQEAQAVDRDGGVHVLNRDCLSSSQTDDNGKKEVRWKHYYRNPTSKTWTSRPLPCGYVSGKRGRLAVSRDNDLYFILPGSSDDDGSGLNIWKAAKSDAYSTYALVWKSRSSSTGAPQHFPLTEPLVDTYRLDHDNVLSVFTRRYAAEEVAAAGDERRIDVVVLDFQL